MYKVRHIEPNLKELASKYKLVIISGAKGTGKKTTLRKIFPNIRNMVIEPNLNRYYIDHPRELLETYNPPIIINDVQNIPKIYEYLRLKITISSKPGQFLLTTTMSPEVLKIELRKFVPGDYCIVEMPHMTQNEASNRGTQSSWLKTYLENPNALLEHRIRASNPLSSTELKQMLWRGNLPGTQELEDDKIHKYILKYIKSVIHEDIKLLERIRKPRTFAKFLMRASHFIDKQLNYADIGRKSDYISFEVVQRWLNLLKKTNQWYDIDPYIGSSDRRLCTRKKGYFCDTGITCCLHEIETPEDMKDKELIEHIFNSHCVNEIMSMAKVLTYELKFYHWLSSSGTKVDLIIESGGRYYPIIFRFTKDLSRYDLSGLLSFYKTYDDIEIMPALVLYLGRQSYRLTRDIVAIPWNAIIED